MKHITQIILISITTIAPLQTAQTPRGTSSFLTSRSIVTTPREQLTTNNRHKQGTLQMVQAQEQTQKTPRLPRKDFLTNYLQPIKQKNAIISVLIRETSLVQRLADKELDKHIIAQTLKEKIKQLNPCTNRTNQITVNEYKKICNKEHLIFQRIMKLRRPTTAALFQEGQDQSWIQPGMCIMKDLCIRYADNHRMEMDNPKLFTNNSKFQR
jgi:hypothetical protein